MKKKLLLFVFALGIISFANAQIIELIGKGVVGETTANLALTDINSIDHVDVGVIYKKSPGDLHPSPNAVTFNNSLNENPPASYTPLNFDYGTVSGYPIGVYEATFNTSSANGVDAFLGVENLHSFYAFVHRNQLDSQTFKSYISSEVVFMYRNGSNNPYVYNIPIETASSSRNVTIKIPVTELKDDARSIIIDITAGPITQHIEETTYNILGNSFLIVESTLENVPGNVNNISVSIYSPNPSILYPDGTREADGDSFFVSGVIADVDKVNEDPGCTLTQGYWKTHSTCKVNRNGKGPKRDDTWDKLADAEETLFFSSGQDYCEVFATEPGDGGKYYILAHQYIAAQLNMFTGADMSAAAAAFTEATTYLNNHSPQDVDGDSYLESKAVDLGGILADFNEGKIGPGHCDDGFKVEMENSYSKVNVYPNPVTDYGTISLGSNNKGRTTIELFNMKGQRVDVIYDSELGRSKKLNKIEFNTSKYKKGRYFVIIKDGNIIHRKQLVVR